MKCSIELGGEKCVRHNIYIKPQYKTSLSFFFAFFMGSVAASSGLNPVFFYVYVEYTSFCLYVKGQLSNEREKPKTTDIQTVMMFFASIKATQEKLLSIWLYKVSITDRPRERGKLIIN